MAEPNNGGAAPSSDTRRQLVINAQYVKDLSFENPRAPQSLLQQTAQPDVQINVDVKAGTLAPDIYEVIMTLRADAKQGGEAMFVVELVYGAVVTLANTPPDDVPQALMVESPRQMFPFARSILAEVTRDGGFTPLLLNPIDFQEIYARRAASGAVQGAPGPAGPLTA
jgi:preprotein translocase subunit SecB